MVRRLGFLLLISAACLAQAAELTVPPRATAGTAISIPTSGSGKATFYLVGPATAIKRTVQLGEAVNIAAADLRDAGRYVAILKDGDEVSRKMFFVTAAQPEAISFLARPSRVPVAMRGVINGSAFVFDKYHNLVQEPTPVKFDLAVEGARPQSRTVETKDGVAWTRMDSDRKAGAAQFLASVGNVEVRRVVQQVAADPCNLRFSATRDKNGILVETTPVRDCSGNPVPDGTIVTFTESDPSGGKSTIDARIKRGVAKAELPPAKQATISVASGVVIGNEINWRGSGE